MSTSYSNSLWQDTVTPREQQKKSGVKILFLTIGSLFFLFIVAYMTRSEMGDYQFLTAPWQPLASPTQLWINTGLLILASISFEYARHAAQKINHSRALEYLWLAGLFTLGFIGGQLAVWLSLNSQGFTVTSNPAHSFYYLLTGLHGLHLLGGLIAWTVAINAMYKFKGSGTSLVERCALYWHFLLLIWLALFALLASSPESFEAFAAFCGLR